MISEDTSLFATPFAIVDLETTGGAPSGNNIIEVAVAVFQYGEMQQQFTSLVQPTGLIPASICALTGILNDDVAMAPVLDDVLEPATELLRSGVVGGHNVKYDLGFLNAAFVERDLDTLDDPAVDTVLLGRRLTRDEAENCKLHTLAAHFGLDWQPTHRALDDVMATAELLHVFIGHLGTFGVTTIGGLLAFQRKEGLERVKKMEKQLRRSA